MGSDTEVAQKPILMDWSWLVPSYRKARMPVPPAERARIEEEISTQAKEIEMKVGRFGGVGPKQKAEIEVEIQ